MFAAVNPPTKFDDTNAIPMCRYAGIQILGEDHPDYYIATCDQFEPVVTDIGKLILEFDG